MKASGCHEEFIAENKIKVYIIDAVSLAREIGLGGRINMVMQSAFFKLANIIPIDDAVKIYEAGSPRHLWQKGRKDR